MVEAACVGSWCGGTGEGEVPVMQVGVADWSGSEVRAWVLVEVCRFFEEAFCRGAGHFLSLSWGELGCCGEVGYDKMKVIVD